MIKPLFIKKFIPLDIRNNPRESRYLIRFNSFFKSEKLSSTYRPGFVKSLIAISDYDERNIHKLAGHKWITKHNDKIKVDLNFIVSYHGTRPYFSPR
jgi:hypothetical protein